MQKQPVTSGGNRPPSEKKQLVPVLLTIGEWRHLFSGYQCKLMIAEALNYCVLNQSLRIRGYLISGSQVYLVLFMHPDATHRILMLFFEKIRRELHAYLATKRNPGAMLTATEMNYLQDESYRSLFTSQPMVQPDYVQFLIGKKKELPYYDAGFEHLKQMAYGNDFCSLKDFSGAAGPVLLDK